MMKICAISTYIEAEVERSHALGERLRVLETVEIVALLILISQRRLASTSLRSV